MEQPEVPEQKPTNPLSPGAHMPRLQVMRGHVLAGLGLGIAGICLGVGGVIFGIAILGILAALCAIGGCFIIAGDTLLPLLRRTEETNDLADRIDSAAFAKPASVAAALSHAGPDHTVIDPITDLPDRRYFEVAVDGRVAAARRHLWPVSIVLVELGFESLDITPDVIAHRNSSLVSFSNLMRQTLREADIACRLNDTTFGLILEDTSEEGGVWTAERLQIALSHDATAIRRLVAGVASYPTHGLFAKDVLVRAQAALSRASSTPAGHGLGQVEVAHVDLS